MQKPTIKLIANLSKKLATLDVLATTVQISGDTKLLLIKECDKFPRLGDYDREPLLQILGLEIDLHDGMGSLIRVLSSPEYGRFVEGRIKERKQKREKKDLFRN